MSDLFEEIKRKRREHTPFKDRDYSLSEEQIDWLITEVERLSDVHKHYLFELDRANNLTKERDELKSKNEQYMAGYDYCYKTGEGERIKKLEAELKTLKNEKLNE